MSDILFCLAMAYALDLATLQLYFESEPVYGNEPRAVTSWAEYNAPRFRYPEPIVRW